MDTDTRVLPGEFRMLVFGTNYSPEETGIAPYTTELTEHLAALGAAVTVVTGMPYYPEWRIQEAYRGRRQIRETIRGVEVLRFRQHVPGRQSAGQRALFELSSLLNGFRALRLPTPDVVLGIVPNLSNGVLANLAARRYRVPSGILFQDMVGLAAAQSGIGGGRRVARVTRALEARVARHATAVAVVSEGFGAPLGAVGVPSERIVHVPNWSHAASPTLSRDETRARMGWTPTEQIVLHAGNMGLKQGLDQVIDAARLAARTRCRTRFVLMGGGSQRELLEAKAARLPNVSFLELQPSERFGEVLHAADALLVTQRSSVGDMSLPSKLTSYFVAGQPVVAAVAESSATALTVRQSGAGLVVPAEQPELLLGALARLAGDADLRCRLSNAGPAYARDHLSRDAALARAVRFVTSLVAPSEQWHDATRVHAGGVR